MKARRILANLELVVKAHLLNPLWRSRQERHNHRVDATVAVIEKYLRRYYLPTALQQAQACPPSGDPERIWSVWLQGEDNAPRLIQKCLATIREKSGMEVCVLDKAQLRQILDLPEVIWQKFESGQMQACHFTDICRVELLHRFGGYWMDATCYMTAPIPEDIVRSDFFLFETSPGITGDYSGFQNCFIRARQGNRALAIWRELILEYWKQENSLMDYFQHQIMMKMLAREVPEVKAACEAMPHITHEAAHRLWLEHGDEPYSAQKETDYTQGTFFQKTSYKDRDIVPGSFKDHLLQ